MFLQARKNKSAGTGGRLRRVLRYGNPCLRRPARPAQAGSPAVRNDLDDLWAVLQTGPGVALAAPQVGIDQALVVVKDTRDSQTGQRLDLVNPQVKETFGPVVDFEEGCLSFPGLYTMIRRPTGVFVEYEDDQGEICSLRDDGLLARIVQHEIDHLQGILFTDHLPAWRRCMLWPRLWWIALIGAISR